MAFKLALAGALVERFHGSEAAASAADHFERVVRKKEVPSEVPETAVALGEGGDRGLLEVLVEVGLAKTNSEGRRLVGQGAVSLDGEAVSDPTRRLVAGSYLVKVGKRRFARISLS